MDKYEMLELLEGVKINFNNSKRVPVLFDIAMEQLQEAINSLDDYGDDNA